MKIYMIVSIFFAKHIFTYFCANNYCQKHKGNPPENDTKLNFYYSN